MPYNEKVYETIDAEEEPGQPVVVIRKTPKRNFWLRLFWQGKIGPAFWTVASLISLAVNIILLVALILLGQQLFTLKAVVQDQVLGGLYTNFQQMDTAHIRTTIPIDIQVPAKFDLPLDTNTTVRLTEDTIVKGMTISNLNAGALYISQAKADITLPAGTELPIALKLTVPVDQKIPVKFNVAVDIPLNKTDLHAPFVGLQKVVKPYYTLMTDMPNSWHRALCSFWEEDPCPPDNTIPLH